ncbi:HlyD family efflux transporter periplasmic adaptor subunit [Parapusillimonas granuli]|uniref:HlyD family efflux transporter periplasmic adaptor subunit n=1 Tax=Parapusillimonas granuli TaxID=380911 RepID=A0A853FWA7_9BURK|nr:HlyD family efflux transporter periplasmic adaptor subunit [Parapusillimonas granuli]MBB5213571.1 membrane fusion protein (multidrug efflux system) [Parapusillimonas granuli]NYT48409.1 HlyD family efflux transporter periplasmic adaptor subunit [Parapusillimonas granuli]
MSPERKPAYRRKTLLLIATLAFAAIGIAYAIWWAVYASHFEATDNAYVKGNLVQVVSQIPGTVVAIEADDTDRVERGAPLVRLDASDAELALSKAKAGLAQTLRQTRAVFVQNDALKAEIDVRKADIERAKADLSKARSDLKRREALAKSGGVSGEEILHARTALEAAESGLAQAQAALAVAKARLATNLALTAGMAVEDHPDVRLAADKLREALLAGSRTLVPAPVSGMIAQRSAQVGQHVAPGAPLMTIVPLDQLWVEANFKESQLRRMKPGQRATLTADVYGGDLRYHGYVQGLAAGTGSVFSLLPAQNASGNWIKVVQRLPVRIVLDPEEVARHPLRVGLSMQVEVDLHDPTDQDVAAARRIADSDALSTTVYGSVDDRADALIAGIIAANGGS